MKIKINNVHKICTLILSKFVYNFVKVSGFYYATRNWLNIYWTILKLITLFFKFGETNVIFLYHIFVIF